MEVSRLAGLLGKSSADVRAFAQDLTGRPPQPDVKQYPDATYENYQPLGFSCCYVPTPSTKSPSTKTLSHVDIFNPPSDNANVRTRRKEAWFGYSSPKLPLKFAFSSPTLPMPPRPKSAASTQESAPEIMERSLTFDVLATTTGTDFVGSFGEPTKKGQGEPGYVPPFLEWDGVDLVDGNGEIVRIGVLVELRDTGAVTDDQGKGASVWDGAGLWVWQSLKVFASESRSS